MTSILKTPPASKSRQIDVEDSQLSNECPSHGLSSNLQYDRKGAKGQSVLARTDKVTTLPGQPWIDLKPDELLPYLRKSFVVKALDSVASWLWLVGTPSESNISSVHRQAIRGRQIVVAEDPNLHLVWYYDKIFLQPIPPYLLSPSIWHFVADRDPELWRAMAGFMRTYCYLTKHEIDFRMAISPELQLIPTMGDQTITFDSFIGFISQFNSLQNGQVSPRYSYGQLRLTRLNYLAPILMGKTAYFQIQAQWSDYLRLFIPSVVTFFAIVSTILGSMQVELAVQAMAEDGGAAWSSFVRVCQWFPVSVIVLVAVFMVGVVLFTIIELLKELVFAISFVRAKKKGQKKEGHAVVAG